MGHLKSKVGISRLWGIDFAPVMWYNVKVEGGGKMTSQEKISSGVSLMMEGMSEIFSEWCQAAQKMVKACGLDKWGNDDDLTLAKGYIAGVISPRAYHIATRDNGRRRKKWLRKCKKRRNG